MVLTIRNFWSLLFLGLETKGLDQMFAKVLSALLGRLGSVAISYLCFKNCAQVTHRFQGRTASRDLGEICLWAWTVPHSPGRPNETLSTNETSHLGSHLETSSGLFWGKAA